MPKIAPSLLLGIAAIALVAIAMIAKVSFFSKWNSQPAISASFDPPFNLVDQDGQLFSDASLAGAPRVLFFGYTSCPDICPTTLADLSRWIRQVKPARTRFVFITVDPEHDTPKVLKSYLSSFAPGIVGLTGKPEDVERTLDAFHIFRQREAEPTSSSYTVDHTATLFLIDRKGALENTISPGEKDESAVAKLTRLDAGAG
jgi:protein SCO1/2